jgi:hypothetical protein
MKKNYFGWSGVYFIFILHLLLRADIPSLLLKWIKLVWSKRSRYFLGTIQQIALTLWPKGVLCYALHTQTFMVVEFTTTCAIIAYHHLSCEFEPHSWRGVLDKTVCDKVCQWLATDLWISLGTPDMCITVPIIVWETILL